MKYLFKDWENVRNRLKDKNLFIFLDYDGTLVPIAGTPDKAVIPSRTKKLLKEISKNRYCRVAVISGRSVDDVKRKIGLNNLIYSGNHGMEIKGPGLNFTAPLIPGHKEIIRRIKRVLEKEAASVKGVMLEDKGFSLALHFRLAAKKDSVSINKTFREAVDCYFINNKVKVVAGKKVLEVRPVMEWDKGSVVLWLLKKNVILHDKDTFFPVYVGDDVTDEDAFGVLENRGITVFVGRPKKSRAQYYLKNTKEVGEFLRGVIKIKSHKKNA